MATKKTGMMEIAFTNGIVRADAKEGFVNLNDMAKIGEVITGKEVRLDKWLENKGTKEFINYVQTQQNQRDFKYHENGVFENNDFTPVFKTKKGRANGGTWANVHIAIDFAMWISVEFKYEVIDTFINGRILDFRALGIDYHKELNAALDTLEDRIDKDNKGVYMQTSMRIKEKVFGSFHSGWDGAEDSAEYQKTRTKIQEELISLINKKYIKTYVDVKEYFNK
ncbi:MAG: KilA-N domain-containing protein [Cetobacterium sp.]|uniref:KilA-N domain-containing protein n=1 Tax=Cetobacterium sp. TaxID=2071632 RepID=UPI003F370C7D